VLRNYLIRNSLFAGLLKQPKEGPPKSCWGYAVDLVKGKCSHPQNLDRELAALRTIAHTEITVRRKLNTTRRRTSNELMGCCCTVRFDNTRQVLTSAISVFNLDLELAARSAENHSSSVIHCSRDFKTAIKRTPASCWEDAIRFIKRQVLTSETSVFNLDLELAARRER
jgi:hypothetical protein